MLVSGCVSLSSPDLLPDPEATSERNGKIALLAAVLVVLLVAYQLGVFEQFRDPAALAKSLVAMGAWGYVAFIVTYTLLHPWGIPGTIFVVAASLIWPWPIAFALSMIGTMCGSLVGFSFARFIARDWVSKRIPARLNKYNDALATRAFTTVVLLRFILWMPPWLHAFFGISKVKFWTHFWGSLVGYLVPLFLMAYFGQKLFDFAKQLPLSAWVAIVMGIVALALSFLAWKKWKSRTRTAPSAEA